MRRGRERARVRPCSGVTAERGVRRWDGVDRGTGWETRLAKARNEREASKNDSYKWATEDM